jgi:hypothetical protein
MHATSPISLRRTVLVLRAPAAPVSGLKFPGGAVADAAAQPVIGPFRGQGNGR